MTSEELKAASWRFDDEFFNKGNAAIVEELLAENFVNHDPLPGQEATREALKNYLPVIRQAFPDLVFSNEAMLADGDLVAHRVRMVGTHQGDFAGVAPTGKQITIRSHDFQRWENGKMVERWSIADTEGLRQQLAAK